MNENTLNRRGPWSIARAALAGLMTVFAANHFLNADEPKKADKTYPKVVLIIRHGEKPPAEAKSPDLSEQGKQRAKALPGLFKSSTDQPRPFPRPDFLFAAHNSQKSHRPLETIKPLAKMLKLTINDTFQSKAEGPVKGKGILELSQELFGNKKYKGKTVLVAWRQGSIPELAKQLGATGFEQKWDAKVFDRVWQITYDKKGNTTFANLPQRLLPGDSRE